MFKKSIFSFVQLVLKKTETVRIKLILMREVRIIVVFLKII
jgi:hypothetical protein